MKLMKKICLLFVLLFIQSCRGEEHWHFNYGYEEIRQIKIVDVKDDEWIDLKELNIELAKAVYDDIKNITMRPYGPNLSSPSGKCFLIVFVNGDYDLISQREPKHCKSGKGLSRGDNSWLYCNEDEFNALINKYLSI